MLTIITKFKAANSEYRIVAIATAYVGRMCALNCQAKKEEKKSWRDLLLKLIKSFYLKLKKKHYFLCISEQKCFQLW